MQSAVALGSLHARWHARLSDVPPRWTVCRQFGEQTVMSGFVAIIEPAGRSLDDADLTRLVGALSIRGDRVQVWRVTGAMLAVGRFAWELDEELSGSSLVVNDGDVSVVADAAIYYRDELRRKLTARGVHPAGTTASHLIAAAYRAWGTECPRYLEGDFAFAIYDVGRRCVFAARDFMGRRPLYFAQIDGAIAIASSVRSIVAHPRCSRTFDTLALAELVGVSLAGHDRTPYEVVRSLPPATCLVGDASGTTRTSEYWRLHVEDGASAGSFDAAAEQLSSLLETAIIERRARVGPTTLWLSGGYDSPIIYGIGNRASDARQLDRLRSVSFSYPVGDPGREDELIAEITRFWDAEPAWLFIDDVRLLDHAAAHAALADIPFPHAFENWLRALLRATRNQDSRVALYGDGGDQLFAVSSVFLRDLFADLHWRELRREWKSFGSGGARALWRSVALPVFAERARAIRAAGRPGIPLPSWIGRDVAGQYDLDGRQAAAEAALASNGARATAETKRSLLNPTIPRVLAGLSTLALEHSVELRAPLLDQRIVEFAMCRPRSERASDGAVKHLLRRAGRDVLPAGVLAPRKEKTGVLTDYFARSFRADPGGVVSDAFSGSRLEELGVVDGAALQQAWHEYKSGRSGGGGHLYVAFQTELWLRARDWTPVVRTDTIPEWTSVPAAGFVQ